MGRVLKGVDGLLSSRNGALSVLVLTLAWQMFAIAALLCFLGKLDGTALAAIAGVSGTIVGTSAGVYQYTRAKFNPGDIGGTNGSF